MIWNKSTWAKIAGWGQLVIESLSEVVNAQGVPHTSAALFRFTGSLIIAIGIHHASNTSAGHPNG